MGWSIYSLLEPLADAIGRHVLNGQAIFADDTPVKMLAPGSGKTKTARLWAYVRDERPWVGEAPTAAWYQFSPDRKGARPSEHLANYTGWMHADGYAGFEELYRSGRVHEVACMSHIRRKFVDVHASQGSAIAEETIRRIARLYGIENEARGQPPDKRAKIRQEKAKPVFDDLEAWLHVQLTKISSKTPLASAIRYALTRMKRLRPYLKNGFLELDNNTAERSMRPIAMKRSLCTPLSSVWKQRKFGLSSVATWAASAIQKRRDLLAAQVRGLDLVGSPWYDLLRR